MSRPDLERVREWATAKLSGGQTFGAGHPYLKVRESVDAILARISGYRHRTVHCEMQLIEKPMLY
jgi:hypothetical protein